jgi:hypothetical protein
MPLAVPETGYVGGRVATSAGVADLVHKKKTVDGMKCDSTRNTQK